MNSKNLLNNSTLCRFDCAGGCGKFQMTRLKKILKADFYVCSFNCKSLLPSRLPGQITVIEFNACGGFTGITHKWPDIEEIESLERAQDINFRGMTQLALEKAKSV